MADFKNALPEQFGWSKKYSPANAYGLAKLLTDCAAFNPNQDFAGIIWNRILPCVPLFNWRHYRSTGSPYSHVDAWPSSQAFDFEKLEHLLLNQNRTLFGLHARLKFKQGGCTCLILESTDAEKLRITVSAPEASKRNPFYFSNLIDALGLERFAQFSPDGIAEDGTHRMHFRVNQRIAGAFEMESLGPNFADNEGILYGLITFDCRGHDEIYSFLRGLIANKVVEWLKVDKVGLFHVPLTSWDHAASLLKEYGTKECLLYVGCLGKDTCQITPPDLDVEMEKYDLITLGFLGGPGLPKSRDVPRFIRERLLSVDMVREDGGWSFCLTSLERTLSQKYRDRLNEYLNTQLGLPFITRSPKDRWKELLKWERSIQI